MNFFEEGYRFFTKCVGSTNAAVQGGTYVQSVEKEISALGQRLNAELFGSNRGIQYDKGFVAEYWHEGTYNANAALRGFTDRAKVAVGERNVLGSPDIIKASGNSTLPDAGVKFYRNGEASAKAQAVSLFQRYSEYASKAKSQGRTPMSFDEYSRKAPALDKFDPLYGGQVRIIPKEQMEDAIRYLKRQIQTESVRRPEQAKRYQETLNLLQDRLRDSNGTESVPLSEKDARAIAQAAKEGKFDPRQFGISTDQLINTDYIRAQAIKAGFSAAAITVALKTAPEIIKGIRHLIQTGEIDREQLKKTGLTALSSGAEGFLRGMVSSAVTIACKSGIWGQALTSVSPYAVGGIVVFAFDALKGGFSVAFGKKDSQKVREELSEEAFSAVGAVALGSALNTLIPVVGYMAGSLLGSTLGSYTYHVVTGTTPTDQMVAYFREQAKFYEAYAAKLLKIDLAAFKKVTSRYIAVVGVVCASGNAQELNASLRLAYAELRISLPWQGDFDQFMGDKTAHLVFS